MNSVPKLIIHGVTDVGLVRDHNEDNIAWEADKGLVILADGMGGHNAGEVASELAVQSIREALEDVLSQDVKEACDVDYKDAVRQAIVYANDQINNKAQLHPEYSGMGTTVVLTLFQGNSVVYANVGDSRIYRYRDDKLEQTTTDHSLVQEMIDNGYMSEEEAQFSMNRNLITRALGIAKEVDVDVNELTVKANDIFLLCSDGLSDLVPNQQISTVISNNIQDLPKAADELIELAKQNGGSDNISVILVSC